MHAHRESLGRRARDADDEVRALAREAEDDLKVVQARLGELNYILAEDEMKDLAVFDRYRDRILGALSEARENLSRLKARGAEWSHDEADLDDAWHRLSCRLDSVRQHVVLEAEQAEAEFDSERAQLSYRLDASDAAAPQVPPSVDFVTRLRREFQQFLPGLKAMFMYAD